MRNYRELEVWQKSHALTLELYKVSRAFPKEELYGLTSQTRRAAVSIGANLAEGCGRPTKAELARFVRIAMGSASELDYHLLLCNDFEFIDAERYQRMARELVRIRKMLSGLLASIEDQIGGQARAAGAWNQLPSTKYQVPKRLSREATSC